MTACTATYCSGSRLVNLEITLNDPLPSFPNLDDFSLIEHDFDVDYTKVHPTVNYSILERIMTLEFDSYLNNCYEILICWHSVALCSAQRHTVPWSHYVKSKWGPSSCGVNHCISYLVHWYLWSIVQWNIVKSMNEIYDLWNLWTLEYKFLDFVTIDFCTKSKTL